MAVVMALSLCSFPAIADEPVVSSPSVTSWKLNDTLATMENGALLPKRNDTTPAAGIFTGRWTDDNNNFVAKVADGTTSYIRAQQGWGSDKTEVFLDLPQAYTTGTVVARFDLLMESTVVDVSYENGQFEWIDAGFSGGTAAAGSDTDFVARALIGASGVNKLDWDGDISGTQTHAKDSWYGYEITVDLDANTRSMVVYDASGVQIGTVAAKSIADTASVDKFRIRPVTSGDFFDEAYLVRNLEVSYTSVPEAEPTSWALNDQIAAQELETGDSLPLRTNNAAMPGYYNAYLNPENNGKGQSVTVVETTDNETAVKVQMGWASNPNEPHFFFDLPEAKTTGVLMATFDLYLDTPDGYEWFDYGFGYGTNVETVSRGQIGNGIHRIDWDTSISDTNACSNATWYEITLTADLTARTTTLSISNASGVLQGTASKAWATDAAANGLNMFMFKPYFKGGAGDANGSVLLKDMVINYTAPTDSSAN